MVLQSIIGGLIGGAIGGMLGKKETQVTKQTTVTTQETITYTYAPQETLTYSYYSYYAPVIITHSPFASASPTSKKEIVVIPRVESNTYPNLAVEPKTSQEQKPDVLNNLLVIGLILGAGYLLLKEKK